MIRKINPKIISSDICQTSLDWLEVHAKEWMKENVSDHGRIWFPDENTLGLTDNFPKEGELVEVILTGSFFVRLLEAKLWPFKNMRLWTFSPRIKSFLIDAFQMKPEEIGVIGRYPSLKQPLPPDFTQTVNLVYAGRLSLTKNITTLLRLTSLLQTHFKRDVTLDIFGKTDNFPDESIGRYSDFSMDQEIEELIQMLPWNKQPVFHGKVPQYEWLNLNRPQPVFISLSSSMYEDFGTAAEIASQQGWPSLLSNWGGHASANHTLLVPMHLVARTHEPVFLQNYKTLALAAKLSENALPFRATQNEPGFIATTILNQSSFYNSLDNFLKKWGPEILLSLREKMSTFADSPKGIEFFKNYHASFAPESYQVAWIINDLAPMTDTKLPLQEEAFEVIYLRELFNPYFLKRILKFKKIVLFDLNDDQPKVHQYLKETLGLDTPLFIWSNSQNEFRELP